MKKLLLTMAAIPALSLAVPAASQVNYNSYASGGIQGRIAQLHSRIDAGLQTGAITRSEARALRLELRQLTRLEAQYARNGLTDDERRDLRMRLRDIRQDVQIADGRRGRWGDDDRYADWDDDDGWGQGGPLDAEFDGWRIDDDCDGRSSGIGRVLGNLLGSNDCMRVGDRVRMPLFDVPYAYRAQFRDRNGVYFRSDGREHIYEIDARTNTVIRVWERDD